MRRLGVSVACLALLTLSCGDGRVFTPVSPTSGAISLPLPSPKPPPAFGERVEVGEQVKSRVTSDDPICAPGWPYRCRYYGLTVTKSGWLYITVAWDRQLPDEYPLDMSVFDPQGRTWDATAGQPAERGVAILATSGTTYVLEIWSFRTPDEEFELRSSIFVQ